MSGYLNNLAARGLGLTELILPRLPSRFEPLSPKGQPVARAWERDNNQASNLEAFDDSQHTAEMMESQILSPQIPIGALRQKNGIIKTELNPTIKKIVSHRQDETDSGLIPEDRLLNHSEIGQEQPSFPATSWTKQSKETDISIPKHFIAEASRLNNVNTEIPKPDNRHNVFEHSSPAISTEMKNFRKKMDYMSIGPNSSARSATQPSLIRGIQPAGLENAVFGRSLGVAPEKNSQSKRTEVEVKRSELESPIHIIEMGRISEAKSKMTVLSDPSSFKITQPSIPKRTTTETHYRKYFSQSETKLAEPNLRRAPEPIIQVTIGSIEVKATPPSTRVKSERRAPPAVSLKEYLQNRGGSK
jgi:hypothetical protein